MKRYAIAALTALILGLVPGLASAETSGSIGGSIRDNGGKPVAGADVTAISPSQVETTRTDGSGYFVFVNLVPGTYTVSIAKPGFASTAFPDVIVSAGEQTRAELPMHVEFRWSEAFNVRKLTDLVNPRDTADVYRITPASNPLLISSPTIATGLMFVPGVQVGMGGGAQ